jgi:phosphoribosylanthranilate isomerase
MFGPADGPDDRRPRVKICGLTTPQDAITAIELGAAALGFNFFRGSRRYLKMEEARDWIAALPTQITKLAVLVNPSWDEAMVAATLPGITALQLHGVETPEFCNQLTAHAIRFVKAIPVSTLDSLTNLRAFSTQTVLLDSGHPAAFGGSGKTFPWHIARDFVEANPDLQVILAGGLTPENVSDAVATVRPFAVDVTSGVESSVGRKDRDRMHAFIASAQRR